MREFSRPAPVEAATEIKNHVCGLSVMPHSNCAEVLRHLTTAQIRSIISLAEHLNHVGSEIDQRYGINPAKGIDREAAETYLALREFLRHPAWRALHDEVARLSHHQRAELWALIQVGNGSAASVADAVAEARSDWRTVDVSLIVERAPRLPYDLDRGLRGVEPLPDNSPCLDGAPVDGVTRSGTACTGSETAPKRYSFAGLQG